MTEESRVSRTPRTWTEGAMPEDRPDVRDTRDVQWAWDCEEEAYSSYGRNEVCSWSKLLRLFGPVVEVLPDAPEPRVLLGWTVPEHISWTVTDGYVTIGCRHGDRIDECATTTSVQNREWIHDFLTKHAHGETVKYRPGSSSGVSSVSPEGETTPGEGEVATEARWYPVVDDTIGGWAISNVDLPVSQLDTRDGEHFTVGDFLSEEIARHICDLHNATLAAGWCPPQPADTEWGCRWPNTNVVQSFGGSRKDAEVYRFPGTVLVHRQVGPWAEVGKPGLSGVEFRDVEERDDASEEQP